MIDANANKLLRSHGDGNASISSVLWIICASLEFLRPAIPLLQTVWDIAKAIAFEILYCIVPKFWNANYVRATSARLRLRHPKTWWSTSYWEMPDQLWVPTFDVMAESKGITSGNQQQCLQGQNGGNIRTSIGSYKIGLAVMLIALVCWHCFGIR